MSSSSKVLAKGANITLPTSVSSLVVGLSWEAPSSSYDLDTWTFLLDSNGMVSSDEDFVFFNNLASPCGSVVASDDNTEGGSEGDDDEFVTVDLVKLPASVDKIAFIVNINRARELGQSFGDLDNASIRLCGSNGDEFARFNLSEGDVKSEASLVFGELYRHRKQWKFRAIAQGDSHGPAELVRAYGVDVENDPEPTVTTPSANKPATKAETDLGLKLSLSKGAINLTKPGAKVNIAKTKSMEFSLYWTNPRKDLGLILQVARSTDVKVSESIEPGTYYDWRNLEDTKNAIVHHGGRQDSDPVLREYATLRLDNDPTIIAVAIMAYSELGNGIGSFRSMGAHAVIDDGDGTRVEVDLNKGGGFSYHTVIAVIVVNPDRSLRVERTSRFSKSGSENRPQIDIDGNVIMNKGPVVFKP